MPIQSVNPANGELLRSFTPLTDEAALEKIGLAEVAFSHYGDVPLSHRALCMRKLSQILEHEIAEDIERLAAQEDDGVAALPARFVFEPVRKRGGYGQRLIVFDVAADRDAFGRSAQREDALCVFLALHQESSGIAQCAAKKRAKEKEARRRTRFPT